jgi:monothiol glutaredoxin
MALEKEVQARIEDLIGHSPIVLFMKGNKHFPQCGFSARVIKMLNETGAKYETFNVLSDAAIRDGIKEFSEWPTIPQLYVNKEFVGGCDIVTEMFQSGELQKLVGVPEEDVAAPVITITEAAVKAFSEAAEPGTTLRLDISADFQYELFFDAAQPPDVVVHTGGLEVRMNRATAKRATGMRVDYVVVDGGGAFKIDNPNEPPRVKPMRVEELKALRDNKEPFVLFDVRTKEERATAQIEGAIHFDANGEAQLASMAKDAKILFHCHHGGRSRTAADRAVASGYRNVYNVEGGIDAWSQRIDPNIARY